VAVQNPRSRSNDNSSHRNNRRAAVSTAKRCSGRRLRRQTKPEILPAGDSGSYNGKRERLPYKRDRDYRQRYASAT
jgi:hypothetical protein